MKKDVNQKQQQLEAFRVSDKDQPLTTNQGLKISEDEHSLKAGERGPTLLEDFHFREKMTHFDHERIPERVVHARGSAAHGIFETYECASDITKAQFLNGKGTKTPVFVRFSTVAGSKGSADTVRDARGFATKFYTQEGNYDLVGNNIPVFFIQDAIKFPDFVHAVKPEPNNEIPQAQSAHDTFWDFIANNQESAHMVMWHMSDRSIPRSYRMMEGFGVNTYRFINAEGKAHFVKFHWKPVLGVKSLVWDEAQIIAGKDPDFHRRDLWESIERGYFPEWELGVQLIPVEDEFKFSFDILDATKIWPEEEIPVRILGKMTLNKNVDNFFAETEQAAFHVGHVVPGIDFSNDPLLQGRLFSYTDTQLIRLGGPNFHELPINKPICPFHNNQRDGYGRQTINVGQVSYHKNSLANNTPHPVSEADGGYKHYEEKVEGHKVRARSESFKDHFSQARLFWLSMTDIEKKHIIDAFSFELGKVKNKAIRKQVVDMYAHVSYSLASAIAERIGIVPPVEVEVPHIQQTSPAVSQVINAKESVKSNKVAVIVTENSSEKLNELIATFLSEDIVVELVSNKQGIVSGYEIHETFATTSSVLYDGVYVTGAFQNSYEQAKAEQFIEQAYQHCKTIGYTENVLFLQHIANKHGVATDPKSFVHALAKHRHWVRECK
ncbi:catalase [Lysinibacillus capsici]|uniref:Catalase n=1 Tax=Lysinibacillus capsici TaxID=2115968 RepID=A0A2X0XI66_9BACI|nr:MULTISPECIES: catalase [Lysinibacillus]AUS88500.1 catalase HPII [Lysinibacillus sp. YS11]KMN37887.1 catalase [Lysinibacillus sp. LK3]MCT1541420.1 catalase [Lysinibacillus capsici]MCT1572680.1 catalase [Lysinibacillus capsici]MCT1649822.1 catalase [Lysinibacillus capsici]